MRADEYCAGIRAIIESRSVQYSLKTGGAAAGGGAGGGGVVITPREGRLEMSAVFFKRKKFFSDNGKIGE